MKAITKYSFVLLAIALAFGSFNPFDLRGAGNISESVEEQRGLTPLLFGLCMVFTWCDDRVRQEFSVFKKYYTPLLALLFFYILSSVIFDISTAFSLMFVKLFVAFTGFISYAIYFSLYPKNARSISLVFAGTCGIICASFFAGLLDGFYYFSNGRLWLWGENPNSYSFVLGLGALILGHEITKDIKNVYKYICGISILMIIAYAFMSGSRGTLICLGVGLLLLFIDFIKKHWAIFVVALVIALSWLNFFFSNYTEELSVFERFNDLQEGDSRQVLIKNAMTLFYDSPFWGYGVNGYEYMKETSFHDIRDSHNMLVSILATSGLLGFTSILCFFKRIIASIRTSFRNDKFATALFVYVFLISMKTGGIITYSMMWFAYALILSNSLFNRNDAKK